MHTPTDNVTPSRPVLMKLLVRSREYRRPRVWVGVRFAAGIWNLGLGVLLLASGHWVGPLAWLGALPLAGAALLFWTGSRLQHSVQN
jgi:hypothetical protein